jgi:hypothetical protein
MFYLLLNASSVCVVPLLEPRVVYSQVTTTMTPTHVSITLQQKELSINIGVTSFLKVE